MPALNPNKQTSMGKEADASPQPKQAQLDKHAGSLLWTNWEYPYSDQWDPKQKLFSYMILPSEAQPCDLDLHEVHMKTTETS